MLRTGKKAGSSTILLLCCRPELSVWGEPGSWPSCKGAQSTGLCLVNQQRSELGHQECSTGWVLWSPLYDAGSEQRGWLVCGSSLLKSQVTDLSYALCEAVSPTSGVRGVREYDGEKV